MKSRQIPVEDVVKINPPKKLTCQNCGDVFECEYKIVRWYPAETHEYFCSEECQKELRDKDLKAYNIEERPFWVYVLELENSHYYVGMTLDLKERLKNHFGGVGSKWTRRHPPLKCVYKQKTDIFDYPTIRSRENEITLLYAQLHGYDKVRGGKWCSDNPKWPAQPGVEISINKKRTPPQKTSS